MDRAFARSKREAIGKAHYGPVAFHAGVTGVADESTWMALDELISGDWRIAAEDDRAQAILARNQRPRRRGQEARKPVGLR